MLRRVKEQRGGRERVLYTQRRGHRTMWFLWKHRLGRNTEQLYSPPLCLTETGAGITVCANVTCVRADVPLGVFLTSCFSLWLFILDPFTSVKASTLQIDQLTAGKYTSPLLWTAVNRMNYKCSVLTGEFVCIIWWCRSSIWSSDSCFFKMNKKRKGLICKYTCT